MGKQRFDLSAQGFVFAASLAHKLGPLAGIQPQSGAVDLFEFVLLIAGHANSR
jgi:hypothetical protein